MARADAEALHKAMKGLGTDDKILVDIFTNRSRKHLEQVAHEFKDLYKKDLESWIKGDTSGNFETILLALLRRRIPLKAKYLHDACAGLGTDEAVLIQILCPLSNEQLKKLDAFYTETYKTDLSKLVKSEISGDFAKVMLAHLQANRPSESTLIDDNLAKSDSERLYKAGEGRLGTDEDVFVEILTRRSRAHLHRVDEFYQQKTGHTLEKGIVKETSGDFGKALIAIITPEADYHARLFDEAMKGLGTKDNQLIRLTTTLTKKQLKAANSAYTKRHNNTLAHAIKGDTSGSYEKVLLAILPSVA